MSKMVKPVDDCKDIKLAIHESISELKDEYDFEGWTRGVSDSTYRNLVEQNSKLVQENKELKEQLKQFDTEKCYVVTSLIENVYDGAKVKILGIKRTKREAWDIVTQKLVKYKQNYEKNDIDYEIESYEQSNILKSDYETITIEYHEIDK